MSNADTRPDRSTDHDDSRPSVDAPLVPGEWSEYRCRRCGEHCINRAEGEPTARELCLDCFGGETAEERATAEPESEEGEDDTAPRSPLRSVRSSLATVAARFGKE